MKLDKRARRLSKRNKKHPFGYQRAVNIFAKSIRSIIQTLLSINIEAYVLYTRSI